MFLRPSQACLELPPDSSLKVSRVRSPPLYPKYLASQPNPQVYSSSWWSRHASFPSRSQRNAPDPSSQRPPISSSGRPSLPSPRRSRRTWSPPAELPRHACARTARVPSSRRLAAAWIPRWRTSCSWTGQAVMNQGWKCYISMYDMKITGNNWRLGVYFFAFSGASFISCFYHQSISTNFNRLKMGSHQNT